MPDAHANFATSLVATAPSPASSGTSLTVTSGEGGLFPTPPFNAVVCLASTLPKSSNAEIVRVTAIAGDVLTIVRAQESSSARTVLVGDQVFAGITKKTLTDAEPVYSDLQNGVVLSTDCALSGAAISSAGLITGTLAAASPLWVTMASGMLIPLTFAGAAVSVTPGTKPASGQYRGYGIEVASDGTVSLATGSADQASLALALANINTVPAAGKVRVADIVMLNTAGTYSLPASATRDRRPWARGAFNALSSGSDYSTASTTPVVIDSTNLASRIECSGVPIRVKVFSALVAESNLGTPAFQLYMDGATVTGGGPYYGTTVETGTYYAAAFAEFLIAPAAGSHLLVPYWFTTGSTATLKGTMGATRFIVEEILKANANNGTA